MSIDEAIAKYKEITNTDAICPAHCNLCEYNKALDDFVKLAKEHDFKYGNKNITNCVIGFIEFFTEQLKVGGENERSI